MTTHKNAGGIGIHWLVFGSGGHETKPKGGVLENFTKCSSKDFNGNYLVKTICDPMKVVYFADKDPHSPVYRRGFYNLDENGNIVGSSSRDVCFEHIRINHYAIKSREEYINIKTKRGVPHYQNNRYLVSMEFFNSHDRNECTDTDILARM